jgi:hypothetical protein
MAFAAQHVIDRAPQCPAAADVAMGRMRMMMRVLCRSHGKGPLEGLMNGQDTISELRGIGEEPVRLLMIGTAFVVPKYTLAKHDEVIRWERS